jgi:hypothetical protein
MVIGDWWWGHGKASDEPFALSLSKGSEGD